MSQETVVYEDLEPVEVRVKLGSKWYVLREADADAGAKFKSRGARALRMSDGKIVGMDDVGDLEPYLVSVCLFEEEHYRQAVKDERRPEPVGFSFVKKLHNRIVKGLFVRAKDMSDLGEKQEADPDPELLSLCRRDLSELHHPDRGGDPQFMAGVNTALDWIKAHRRPDAKNSPNGTTPSSELPAS